MLRSNQLDQFRDLNPIVKEHLKVERTKDNYFWILIEFYYTSLNQPIEVENAFNLYLDVFSTSKLDPFSHMDMGEQTEKLRRTENAQPTTMIFSPRSMFNLLHLAYADYGKRRERQLRYGTDAQRTAVEESVYQKMLDTIERRSSERRRRLLHGAVLLANGKSMEFFDEYKMANQELSVDDVEYLCRVAKVVKRPEILEPLIEVGYFLPDHDPTIANIYNVLALLYGQNGDVPGLERLWRCLRRSTSRRRLPAFRHPLNRIRHFYRCANVAAPQALLKIIRQIDP